MNISFPNNFLTSDRQMKVQNLQRVTETDSGRKQIPKNNITAETGPDKEENDRLLRRMQLAQTKSEVMEHYFGAMQTAVRESGSNGIVMGRRVNHLAGTHRMYQETEQYKKKKDQDTFLIDQLEALKKRQEEMEQLKESQTDAQEDAYQKEQDVRQPAGEDVSSKREATAQQNRNASSVQNQNADLQKKAAMSYKTKDAPSRNPTMQGVFTGMI